MGSRHPNYRLAKIHRNYSVEEAAKLFGVHRNTVRAWIKQGLRTSDDKRPTLILGRDLSEFLRERRLKNKRPCQPGQLYCVRCRVPRNPAREMAEYQPLSATLGNLVGVCPVCEAKMFRRISLAKINDVRGTLAIAFARELRHSTG